MSLVQYAAILAAILMAGLAVFQAALARGAPLGRFAWGGTHGDVLPSRLRIGSAISSPLLIAMGVMVLIRTRVIYPQFAGAIEIAIWIVFVFLVLNTSANFRSKSPDEKRVMGPIALILAALVAYIAINAG